VKIVIIVVGILFGIGAVATTSIYAKRELDKVVKNSMQVENENDDA